MGGVRRCGVKEDSATGARGQRGGAWLEAGSPQLEGRWEERRESGSREDVVKIIGGGPFSQKPSVSQV